MLTRSVSFDDKFTICTELSSPTSSGPITVAPPSSCSILVEIEAEWNAGMTSTFAGPGQAAERIGRHQLRIERDVRRHLAVILEIDALLVEDAHRVLHLGGALARRMAEGREGEQRDARLVAELARHAGRFDGDLGDVLGRRHLGHGGIGHQHGAAARQTRATRR